MPDQLSNRAASFFTSCDCRALHSPNGDTSTVTSPFTTFRFHIPATRPLTKTTGLNP